VAGKEEDAMEEGQVLRDGDLDPTEVPGDKKEP